MLDVNCTANWLPETTLFEPLIVITCDDCDDDAQFMILVCIDSLTVCETESANEVVEPVLPIADELVIQH